MEGNAIKDLRGNYFPGVNGRRSFTSLRNDGVLDACRVSEEDSRHGWPAVDLLSPGDDCQITFVVPYGMPDVVFPAFVNSLPISDISPIVVNTPPDTSLCYSWREPVYWNSCRGSLCTSEDFSFNREPPAPNLKFVVVTNTSQAFGSLSTPLISALCSTTDFESRGRTGCIRTSIDSLDMKVFGGVLAKKVPQCWLSSGGDSMCCNPHQLGAPLTPLRVSREWVQLIEATVEEGAVGYTGKWIHRFYVSKSDSGISPPAAKWIMWEGVDVDTTKAILVSHNFNVLGSDSLTGTNGYFGQPLYSQGIHIQWSRSVALKDGYVRFICQEYLEKTGKNLSSLLDSDYYTTSVASPGCAATYTIYTFPQFDTNKMAFGRPCRIPILSTEAELLSSDHLMINPYSLIPGSYYNVHFDKGLVYALSDSNAINEEISFNVLVKQVIDWGSYASPSTISPPICCRNPGSISHWTTSLDNVYAQRISGYIHYSQTFMTTFIGPVKVGKGHFLMKCDVQGIISIKVRVKALDTDQVIIRGVKLLIDPRDSHGRGRAVDAPD